MKLVFWFSYLPTDVRSFSRKSSSKRSKITRPSKKNRGVNASSRSRRNWLRYVRRLDVSIEIVCVQSVDYGQFAFQIQAGHTVDLTPASSKHTKEVELKLVTLEKLQQETTTYKTVSLLVTGMRVSYTRRVQHAFFF